MEADILTTLSFGILWLQMVEVNQLVTWQLLLTALLAHLQSLKHSLQMLLQLVRRHVIHEPLKRLPSSLETWTVQHSPSAIPYRVCPGRYRSLYGWWSSSASQRIAKGDDRTSVGAGPSICQKLCGF